MKMKMEWKWKPRITVKMNHQTKNESILHPFSFFPMCFLTDRMCSIGSKNSSPNMRTIHCRPLFFSAGISCPPTFRWILREFADFYVCLHHSQSLSHRFLVLSSTHTSFLFLDRAMWGRMGYFQENQYRITLQIQCCRFPSSFPIQFKRYSTNIQKTFTSRAIQVEFV